MFDPEYAGRDNEEKCTARKRGIPMASVDLEPRVAALEAEVAKLKAALATASGKQYPWWEEIAGSFANDPAFEEAMRLGREWRDSFKPKARKKKKTADGRARYRSRKSP